MPELTNERLVEIESRAAEVASRDHLKATRISDEWIALHARIDTPLLIAELRRLRAERLTPEERELLKRACMCMFDSLSAKRTGAADREADAIMAVRAKIEAARDGGEGC